MLFWYGCCVMYWHSYEPLAAPQITKHRAHISVRTHYGNLFVLNASRKLVDLKSIARDLQMIYRLLWHGNTYAAAPSLTRNSMCQSLSALIVTRKSREQCIYPLANKPSLSRHARWAETSLAKWPSIWGWHTIQRVIQLLSCSLSGSNWNLKELPQIPPLLINLIPLWEINEKKQQQKNSRAANSHS